MLRIRKKYNILQVIQLILLFLMSMNFQNLYFYMIFAAFFVSLLANVRHFRVDAVSILLTLLSVCYIVFYAPTRSSYTLVLKQFSYPLCYLIGLNLYNSSTVHQSDYKEIGNQINLAIWVSGLGSLLHYILNASINMDSLVRNTVDYWTGAVVSATHQALLAVIAIAVCCVELLDESKIWKKIFSLLGLLVIFIYNLVLAGRTIMFLGVITLAVAFLYVQKHTRANARIKRYLLLCLLIITAVLLFFNNTAGIRDWILSSNLSDRFNVQEVLMDIRLERKILYIINMYRFPFGGGHLRNVVGGYAHELYLDAYSDVGIIGYGLIVATVVIGIVNVAKVLKSKLLSHKIRNMILCVFLVINIVLFLEPILQGVPWFFCIFCFLNGVIKSRCDALNKPID